MRITKTSLLLSSLSLVLNTLSLIMAIRKYRLQNHQSLEIQKHRCD